MSDTISADKCIDTAVEDVFGVGADEFDDSTSFGPNGLDVDSLQVVEMVETIEYELDVRISDDDLEDIETVGDTKDVVRAATN